MCRIAAAEARAAAVRSTGSPLSSLFEWKYRRLLCAVRARMWALFRIAIESITTQPVANNVKCQRFVGIGVPNGTKVGLFFSKIFGGGVGDDGGYGRYTLYTFRPTKRSPVCTRVLTIIVAVAVVFRC